MIDMDNQAWLSVGRFDFLSPLPQMLTAWDDLQPGDDAIWHTVSPQDFTPERIEGFVAAAGLVAGDTLILDPISKYFGQLMGASEYSETTKGGGERVNWRKLKPVYGQLINCLTNLKPDVVATRRMGFVFDEKGVPTGEMKPSGEKAITDYEFPFVWRFEDSGDDTVMTYMKKKGGFFKYGQQFKSPILRDIYAPIYAHYDKVRPKATRDAEAAVVEGAQLFAGNEGVVAEVIALLRATDKKSLAKVLVDPVMVAKCKPLSEHERARIRAVYEEVAK
jgi:hypothetical protein